MPNTKKSFKHTHYRPTPIYGTTMASPGPEIIIKMTLELFRKVPTGAIETFFDEEDQPLFKRADLGKYLGIEDKNIISRAFHHITPASDGT